MGTVVGLVSSPAAATDGGANVARTGVSFRRSLGVVGVNSANRRTTTYRVSTFFVRRAPESHTTFIAATGVCGDMDSVSHFGVRTVGQASDDSSLATFTRQWKPTVERGATGIRRPVPLEVRSDAPADSDPRHRRAPGEAHGYW